MTDERGLSGCTTLEAFQSGLSWPTILRKRNASTRRFCFEARLSHKSGTRHTAPFHGE